MLAYTLERKPASELSLSIQDLQINSNMNFSNEHR